MMNKKEKYDVKLSQQDMYWLQTLLIQFIEKEANIHQIEDTFPLLQKLRSIKNETS